MADYADFHFHMLSSDYDKLHISHEDVEAYHSCSEAGIRVNVYGAKVSEGWKIVHHLIDRNIVFYGSVHGCSDVNDSRVFARCHDDLIAHCMPTQCRTPVVRYFLNEGVFMPSHEDVAALARYAKSLQKAKAYIQEVTEHGKR